MKKLIVFLLSLNFLFAFDFKLKPIKLNENSYYFLGDKEYFSKDNGGDISNSAFIITKNSVILIDTGSTVEYAKQVKETIAKITNKPVKYVINTHHHPDHFMGNNAFKHSDIYATEHTAKIIKEHGDLYVSNIVNLLGEVAYTTRTKAPNKIINKKSLVLDGYELEILFLHGHTHDDIVLFDKKNKTLYTSDLIFNQRALATPHADIQKWINSLEGLKKLDFNILIPGHGKHSFTKTVINENIEYLEYVHNTLKSAVKNGLDSFEILSMVHPKRISSYSMFKEEFERTVINLYPKYERKY
jgi:uncharacterized sulfatase